MPLTLRLPGDVHRLAAIAAASRRQSLHTWLMAAVRAQLLRDARTEEGAALAAALDAEARRHVDLERPGDVDERDHHGDRFRKDGKN